MHWPITNDLHIYGIGYVVKIYFIFFSSFFHPSLLTLSPFINYSLIPFSVHSFHSLILLFLSFFRWFILLSPYHSIHLPSPSPSLITYSTFPLSNYPFISYPIQLPPCIHYFRPLCPFYVPSIHSLSLYSSATFIVLLLYLGYLTFLIILSFIPLFCAFPPHIISIWAQIDRGPESLNYVPGIRW